MFMSNGQSSVFVDSDGGLTCWENSWLCWDYLMLITTPVIGDRWSIRLLGLGLLDVRCWDDMVIKGPIQAIHLPSCCLKILNIYGFLWMCARASQLEVFKCKEFTRKTSEVRMSTFLSWVLIVLAILGDYCSWQFLTIGLPPLEDNDINTFFRYFLT